MLEKIGMRAAKYPNLTIINGSCLKQSDLVKALAPNGQMVDVVVSGVGFKGSMTYFPPSMKIDNKHICEETVTAVFAALRNIPASAGPKPLFTTISTTGISKHGRDVPVACLPFYGMLSTPHKDKSIAEDLVVEEGSRRDEKRAISSYLIVRPSLLTNGVYTSMNKIKVGGDREPAIGYTISRNDVGMFIYNTAIKGFQGSASASRIMSITY